MAGIRGPVFSTLVAALVVAAASWISLDVASAAEAAPSRPKRPNIVLVITDDQGYGDISAHGNPILKTPNLDRLHAESVRFTDFHVSPTCSPTRASLMTGRHEFRSGVTHTILERERLSLSATTLPQSLKTAGYVNGIFGKWHLGDEAEYQPDRRGFDEVFIHGGGGIGQTYVGSCGDAPNNKYFDPAILHNGKFEKTKGYCTDIFFNEALKWIAGCAKPTAGEAAPFFCYIATNAPHGPLHVPPEYEAKYAQLVKTPEEAKFFGMIANIDDNVGRLTAKLGELGIERETLVIFMNDNGGTVGTKIFNAGMRGQKVTPYRGGTRGASFWRLPGAFEPGDCDRLAAHIDIFPTLAELVGAKVPAEVAAKFDGRSLMPLLTNHQAGWSDRILFTHVGRWPKGSDANRAKFMNCSIRDPRWNLVTDYSRRLKLPAGKPTPPENGPKPILAQWELFDLKADPGETTNVADAHPDVVERLTKAYDAWWDEVVPATVENERAVGPAINPYHAIYYAQFGGAPPAPKRTQETATKPAAKPAAPAKPVDPAFAPVVDDPKLPRVLLIGDSISIGYTVDVRKKLAGKANVHRIPVNGGPTTNGITNLATWLAPNGAPAKWDVIHFNWGLHDLKYMPDGKRQVDPESYEVNLRALVKQMQATGATLIWCSTTPVPEGVKGVPRKPEDAPLYNERAKKVMDELKVETNDLYSFALPKLKEIQIPVNVHFTPAGSAVLAEQVAAEIEKRLPKK